MFILRTNVREYHQNFYLLKSGCENLTRLHHQMHLTTPANREDE